MFKKLTFLFLICLCLSTQAQLPSSEVSADFSVFPKEKIALSINSNLLLAGELLLYKTYNLTETNKLSPLSKVMYVSLRNEKDSIVFSHKLRLENGTAYGDFFIPATLKTGIYRLIAYTNFSRNNEEEAYSQEILYVINPYVKTSVPANKENLSENVTIASKNILVENMKSQNDLESISLKTDRQIYSTREKVTVTIENPNADAENGNYTISVRRIEPIKILDSTKLSQPNPVSEKQKFFLPEMRGEIISGKLISENADALVGNKIISLTIPGPGYIFKLAKTDNKGRFFIPIDENYDTSNAILEVNEANATGYKIELDNKQLPLGKTNSNAVLNLNPNIKDWLQERSVQLQIENGYYNAKRDSVIPHYPSARFFDDLGTVYRLDEFTRFPSVRETFIEIVTSAGVRKEGEGYKFIVFNEYDPDASGKFNSIDPLVLMDGMLIQDNEEVLNYNSKEIESIRVISKPYRYGPKIYSGIITIETKKGGFVAREGAVNQLEVKSPINRKEYYTPNYSQQKLERIPDYRVQLLWQPDLNLAKKNQELSFYTSDVEGYYEIKFEGVTNEGNFITVKKYIEVDKET